MYTRRSAGNMNPNPRARRPETQPPLTNNFIPGGQLAQGNKPQQMQQRQGPIQTSPAQPVPQQQGVGAKKPENITQKTPTPQQQAAALSALKTNPQPSKPPQIQQQNQAKPPQIQQQNQAQPPQIQQQNQANVQNETEVLGNNAMSTEDSSDGLNKKPFWMKKPAGKINKKERLRRRNMRLRKILQPKNAVMVLHELVGNVTYNTTEIVTDGRATLYRTSVVVDGEEHVGIEKSKMGSKQCAAESAIKKLVTTKLRKDALKSVGSTDNIKTETDSTNGGGELNNTAPSEVSSEGGGGLLTDPDLSLSHIASYALHKLLTAWDDGGNLAERIVQLQAYNPQADNNDVTMSEIANIQKGTNPVDLRPAKKLPENAALMNPIMLLNQMKPYAVYEEVSMFGSPPNIQFTMKCSVDNEVFLGTGSSKKSARKQCAYAACIKVLGIMYPPDLIESEGLQKLQEPMQI